MYLRSNNTRTCHMAICSCLLPYQTLALAVSAFELGSASTSLSVSTLQHLPIFPLPHPHLTSSLKQIIFNITPLVQPQSSAPVSITTVEVIFAFRFFRRFYGRFLLGAHNATTGPEFSGSTATAALF